MHILCILMVMASEEAVRMWVYVPCILMVMASEEAVRTWAYVPCILMVMAREKAVRMGAHTVYFDGHGQSGGSKDVRTYRVF